MSEVPEEAGGAESAKLAASSARALLASRVLISGLGWVGSVIVARVLTPEGWGQYSFVFGLLSVLNIVTELSIGRVVLARLIDGDPEEVSRVASSFIVLRTTLGIFGYLLAVGYVLVLGYPSEVVWATVLGGIGMVLAAPSNALTILYQSRLKLVAVAIAESIGQIVQLVMTIAAALFAPVLLVFVLPLTFNQIAALVIKIRGVLAGGAGPKPSRVIEFRRWKEMLIESIPVSIGTTVLIVMTKIDILMLGRWDTFESVGLYAIGGKFYDLVGMAMWAVTMPLMTLLMTAWPNQMEEFRQMTRRSFAFMGLACMFGLVLFLPSAHVVIQLLYGGRFVVATQATQLLVISAAFLALTELGILVLISAGKYRVYPFVVTGALGLNIILNYAFIPLLSFNGAAIATVATEAILMVGVFIVVHRSMPIRGLIPIGRLFGLAAITIVVITAMLPWVPNSPILGPVFAAFGGLVFILTVRVLGLAGGLGIRNVVAMGMKR